MTRTDFELSRIYGRGWTDGKKALAERSDEVEKIEDTSINPYQTDNERERWATGFSEALRSKRKGTLPRASHSPERRAENRPLATAHRFKLGQVVTITESMFERSSVAARQTFQVSRLLPIESGIAQYRIKSSKDNHERVVEESRLVELKERDGVLPEGTS